VLEAFKNAQCNRIMELCAAAEPELLADELFLLRARACACPHRAWVTLD